MEVSPAKSLALSCGTDCLRRRSQRFAPRGPNAVSYKAKHHDGRMAFLKQYSSPTPAVDWYNGYRKYEIEKRSRLVNSDALKYCLVPIDIFEAVHGCNTFFQAYDFIEGGEDLKQFLTRIQSAPICSRRPKAREHPPAT